MEKSRWVKAMEFGGRVLLLCSVVWFVFGVLHQLFPSIPLFGFIAQTPQFAAVASLYCIAAGILSPLTMLVVFPFIEDDEKAAVVAFAITLCILIWLRVFH